MGECVVEANGGSPVCGLSFPAQPSDMTYGAYMQQIEAATWQQYPYGGAVYSSCLVAVVAAAH